MAARTWRKGCRNTTDQQRPRRAEQLRGGRFSAGLAQEPDAVIWRLRSWNGFGFWQQKPASLAVTVNVAPTLALVNGYGSFISQSR